MKRKIVAILLACAVFVGGAATAVAAGVVQDITAQLRPDYTIVIDGVERSFSDVNGNIVFPVVYNGTTYLPVRAIGGIMGKEVGWDGNTKTVTLSESAKQLIVNGVEITSIKTSDELKEISLSDAESTISGIVADYETLAATIDTFDEYQSNTDAIETFYDNIIERTELLCIRMREYCVMYAESVMSSDISIDDKYDAMDDIYDYIYEDVGDDIYNEIYDGILDDMYDYFYDGVIDGAYDFVSYSIWSDARSEEYNWWSDARSDVYDIYTDMRSDVYSFWSEIRGDLYRDDVEEAIETLNDFRADIEKLK